MDIAVKKVELIEWIARLQDEKLIQRIETLKKSSVNEIFEQRIPKNIDELKSKLEKAENDISNGNLHSQQGVENYFKNIKKCLATNGEAKCY